MNEPALVCLLATWHDEDLLAKAVASASPHVDRVIVLDGIYAGLDGVPQSTFAEWDGAEQAGALVFGATHKARWRGEVEKRNVLLELGRAFVPSSPRGRWALVLDADELLVGGERLRELCAAAPADRFALPLLRFEPNGQASTAPSRLFRLTSTVRYAGRSYWLRNAGGEFPIDLMHNDAPCVHGERETIACGQCVAPMLGVHVLHRWDHRSPDRQELRRRWGRELALSDHGSA